MDIKSKVVLRPATGAKVENERSCRAVSGSSVIRGTEGRTEGGKLDNITAIGASL